ncbi:insulin-like growth factor 2 mRNA-binding protein 1 [Diaphorina citri]|uniref:Insulin-like growth factor 2 mRNA-binding protein 1 n=1 Tax=Diaphorina citri TaxID=121845 RepID=A0A1S3DKZ5_DIACI|nr:insulin-like growth factor 2 mRNA-binding protein 1 [Diaphorina citri]
MERGGRSGGGRRNNRSLSAGGYSGGYSGVTSSSTRHADFPLRILVQSDMVGAIIGRQGSTIRNVTQQTRARYSCQRENERLELLVWYCLPTFRHFREINP